MKSTSKDLLLFASIELLSFTLVYTVLSSFNSTSEKQVTSLSLCTAVLEATCIKQTSCLNEDEEFHNRCLEHMLPICPEFRFNLDKADDVLNKCIPSILNIDCSELNGTFTECEGVIEQE